MKTHIKYILLAVVCAWSAGISAQHVNTMYFLENTPMRHTLNPAFQPVSKGCPCWAIQAYGQEITTYLWPI